MKLFLVFIAVLGFTQADAGDDVAAAKLVIECGRKAIDGGLPSIPVPNHNPLVIKNITFGDSKPLYSFNISITSNLIYDLVDFNFTKIEARYTSPARVVFDYDLYWPKVTFIGNYDISIKTPFYKTELKGAYNVVLEHVDWTGIFNLTKPGQEGIQEHLDDLTLVSKAKAAHVDLNGDIDNLVAEGALKTIVLSVFNHFPAQVGTIFRDRSFNNFWIDHPERIDMLLATCAAK